MGGEMDFCGQMLANNILNVLMLATLGIGLSLSFYNNRFIYCAYACFVGCCVGCVLCVPSWPMYNKNPLAWQPCAQRELIGQVEEDDEEDEEEASPNGKGNSNKSSSKKGPGGSGNS